MKAGGLYLAKGNNAEHLGGNFGVFSPRNEHSSVELGFRGGANYLGSLCVTGQAEFQEFSWCLMVNFLQRIEMHGRSRKLAKYLEKLAWTLASRAVKA